MTTPRLLSLDEALIGRTLHTPVARGDVFYSSTPLADARAAGAMLPIGADLWASPEALAAEAHLHEAACALPTPLSYAVHDMLSFNARFNVPSTAHVRRREAFADAAEPRDALALPVPRGADSATGDAWIERDDSSEPTVLLLQHRFQLRDGRELTVRTLLLASNLALPPAAFGRAAFGDAPVAVQPRWEAGPQDHAPAATAVALDGAWLTAAQLAALPQATRNALTACRSAQLISTLRGIIERRWPGGYGMLRKRALPLVGNAAAAVIEGLAALLVLARAGGRETYQLMKIRTHRAEYLEADGCHVEAAGLYLLNCASQQNWGVHDDPSDSWVNLGVALQGARDGAAAAAAFRRALQANVVVPPDSKAIHKGCAFYFCGGGRSRDAAERESQRLRVLNQLFKAEEIRHGYGAGVAVSEAFRQALQPLPTK